MKKIKKVGKVAALRICMLVFLLLTFVCFIGCENPLQEIIGKAIQGRRPEITVKRENTEIPSGGTYNFIGVPEGSSADEQFTIENTGDADLELIGGERVAVNGDEAFSLISDQPNLNILPGEFANFTIKFSPPDMENRESTIIIVSNDPDESEYIFTLAGSGEGIAVTDVSLNKSSTSITVGYTDLIVATVEPAAAFDKSISWSSDMENVATVDSNGLITAKAEGTATVTVSTSDGGFTASCNVNVLDNPQYFSLDSGTVSFNMYYVPDATFPTGTSDNGESTVSSFWMGETEVTFQLWLEVYTWAISNGYSFENNGILGNDNSGSNQEPVTTINWRDAMVWCNALTEYYNNEHGTNLNCAYKDSGSIIRDSRVENATQCDGVTPDYLADGFRLPSSDEWELAARYINDYNDDDDIMDFGEYYPGDFASGADRDNIGNGSGDIDGDGDEDTNDEVAVYVTTSTAVVSSKDDNKLWLHDMSGNVWEWCFDWHPNWVGLARESRGGSWNDTSSDLQVGERRADSPQNEYNYTGFRLSRRQ